MLISYDKVSLDNLGFDFQPARWLNTTSPVPDYSSPDSFCDFQEQVENWVSQLLVDKPYLCQSSSYANQLQFQGLLEQLSGAVMELLETNKKAIGLPV